jgi:hypothetical protein
MISCPLPTLTSVLKYFCTATKARMRTVVPTPCYRLLHLARPSPCCLLPPATAANNLLRHLLARRAGERDLLRRRESRERNLLRRRQPGRGWNRRRRETWSGWRHWPRRRSPPDAPTRPRRRPLPQTIRPWTRMRRRWRS